MTTPWTKEQLFESQSAGTYDGVTNVEGLLLYDDPDDTYDGKQLTVWTKETVSS